MAKVPGTKSVPILWLLVVGLGVAVAGVAMVLFLNIIQTQTYYVLREDVPARAEIHPDLLEPITVSKDGAPPTALTIEDIQDGGVFTAHPLLAGDILTASNVGTREDISIGIPDEWVVTNFSVDADNAVGGRIQRGFYFDILVIDDAGGFYPFVNVLALDTTVNLSGASNEDAANTEEAKSGIHTQYVVGMSPENAAKLHHIVNRYPNIKLVLSPRANEYQKPNLADYTGIFSYSSGDAPVNLGEGTDYTFTVLERDKFGRLIEELVNCGDGNAVINDEEVCKTKGQIVKPNDSESQSQQSGATSGSTTDTNSANTTSTEPNN